MWNERLAARARQMRERAALRPDPGYTESQLSGLASYCAVRKGYGDHLRSQTTVVRVPDPATSGKPRRARGRGHGPNIDPIEGNYPPCPRCLGAQPGGTIRAGKAHGIQRYRCTQCRRTFSGGSLVIEITPRDYRLICCHCGSDSTDRMGRGQRVDKSPGQRGRCRQCGLYFVQGGKKDLETYHLLLAQRVAELGLQDDVEAEVYQQAALDVLAGKGYCWTVELKKRQAWRVCRGEYKTVGTDSYALYEAGAGGADVDHGG